MWATEDVVFKRFSGASSHYDIDEPKQYLRTGNKLNDYKGAVLHQNTCGHGYTPRESYHIAENTFQRRENVNNGPFANEGDNSNSVTLLGASPSEIAFRGGSDRRKRWAST